MKKSKVTEGGGGDEGVGEAVRALRRLVAVTGFVLVCVMVLMVAGTRWLLGGSEGMREDVWGAIPWLVGVTAVAVAVVWLGYAGAVGRWVNSGSEEAREVLLAAPRRAAIVMSFGALGVLLLGVFAGGWVAFSHRWAMVLVLWGAMVFWGAMVMYPVTRWALWPVMAEGGKSHEETSLAVFDRLEVRGAVAVAVPVGVVGLLGALVVIEGLGEVSVVWALIAAGVAVTVGWSLGVRVGREMTKALGGVARRVDSLRRGREGEWLKMSEGVGEAVPEVMALAQALDAVAEKIGAMSGAQRRALTTRLEAARLRSFVLAGVSHDLRGPLNAVLGFSGLLLSGAEGALTEGQRESIGAIEQRGRDLLRLVDDLLDSAKLDAGRMSLHGSRVAVGELLNEALKRASVRVGETVKVVVEGELGGEVSVDVERTAGALGALVAFGWRRAGVEGRAVMSLRVRGVDKGVEVVLRGCGSAPTREAMEGLFEAFDVKVEGARAQAGAGLAAAVAKRVLVLQGGGVEAEAGVDGEMLLRMKLP